MMSPDTDPVTDPTPPPDGEAPPPEQRLTVPPFSARRLAWELWTDTLIRAGAVAAALAGVVAISASSLGGSLLGLISLVVLLTVWLGVNATGTRVSRELPRLVVMIEQNPAAGEDRLARLLARRALMRWVRLMLYHRLAVLRHRQGRFREAAAIGAALRRRSLGPARDARPALLLLLAESALECDDLDTAGAALNDLRRLTLSLPERLQELAVQTRYELTLGDAEAAVDRVHEKIRLAELMPATSCGAVHAMLATAADRVGQPRLARWLWDRAELLVAPDPLSRFRQGVFSTAPSDPGSEPTPP